MALDLMTMVWLALFAGVSLSTVVLMDCWSTPLRGGLFAWGWGIVAQTLAYPAAALLWVGFPAASVLLNHGLGSLAFALHILAVCQFQSDRARPLSAWFILLPVPAVAILIAADNKTCAALSTLILAFQCALLVQQAWGPDLKSERVSGRLSLCFGALAYGLTLVVRAIFIMAWPDIHGPLSIPVDLQSLTWLVNLMAELVMTVGYVLMQKDRALSLAHHLAAHDPLTGVASRRALMDGIAQDLSLASRQQGSVAVLMIDVDRFKSINDRHGHLAGDAVLREVSRRIGERLRRRDRLGRYGGEEFIVLLGETDIDGATTVAEDIRHEIAVRPVVVGEEEISVTFSIGVHARIPGFAATDIDEILLSCDRAMYAAKKSGRNRVMMGV